MHNVISKYSIRNKFRGTDKVTTLTAIFFIDLMN